MGYEGMNRDSGQYSYLELVWLLIVSLEGSRYNDVDTEHFDWIEVFRLYLSSRLLPTVDTFQVYRDQTSGRDWNHEESRREARIAYSPCLH